jgi:hypothetical protein
MSERTEQFTPGQWIVLEASNGCFSDACIVSTVDGIETACLAIVCGNGYGFWRNGLKNDYPNMSDIDIVNIEMKANANLMSAAPNLYKELAKLEWRLYDQGFECPCCFRTKEAGHTDDCELNKALKKARGEQ